LRVWRSALWGPRIFHYGSSCSFDQVEQHEDPHDSPGTRAASKLSTLLGHYGKEGIQPACELLTREHLFLFHGQSGSLIESHANRFLHGKESNPREKNHEEQQAPSLDSILVGQ
jgi:hypothetical protein